VKLLLTLLQRSFVTPILVGLSFVMICGCEQQFRNPDVMLSYPNNPAANALTWNGKDLVIGRGNFILNVTNIKTEGYESYSPDSAADGDFTFGEEAVALMRQPMEISGLAWEGECCGNGFLWVVNSVKKEIIKYDSEKNILKIIPSPGNSPRGLAFDGKDLWLADTGNGKIYRISTADGSILSTFISPVGAPAGVASSCKNIWVVGRNSCRGVNQSCDKARLIQIDPKNGQILNEVPLPVNLTRPTAMVWSDGIMWISDYNLNRIFKISID